MVGARHDRARRRPFPPRPRSPRNPSPPQPDRAWPLRRGAAHARSSARRRCRPAACRAGGWRRAGPGSGSECRVPSSKKSPLPQRPSLGPAGPHLNECRRGPPAYTGCKSAGKPAISAALRASPAGSPATSMSRRGSVRSRWIPSNSTKSWAPFWGRAFVLLSVNIVAGAYFRADQAGQARLRHRGAGSPGWRRPSRPGRAREADRGTAGLVPTPPRARIRPRNAPPATPSTRAARTGSVPISGAWSIARRPRRAGSIIPPP